jgi:hypothetical protein
MLKKIVLKLLYFYRLILCEFDLLFRKTTKPSQTVSQSIRQWLIVINSSELQPVRGRVLISALRNRTWIEWAVYCACMLRRLGFESTLFYDGQLVQVLYPAKIAKFNFFRQASKVPGIRLVDINLPAKKPAESKWMGEVNDWAITALAYDLHIEENDINNDLARYAAQLKTKSEYAAHLASGLEEFLSANSFQRAFLYSGLIGESKVLLTVLRSFNIDTICLEGWGWRPGHLIYNLNAPALEYNMDGWIKSTGEWDATKEKEMQKYLRFLEGEDYTDSKWLNNFYRVQRSKAKDDLPQALATFLEGSDPIFLLAPNVIGDSSMLNRHTFFPGEKVWIREIIDWFKKRPSVKLVIRAHPGEVWAGPKCQSHIGEFARKEAKGIANVFVIDGFDKVNTFALIPYVRAGLVWISNAGVDFVLRGLPVMTAARPKYSGMGIVLEPDNKLDYFQKIEEWIFAQDRPTPMQISQGKRYLYVVFKGFSFEACSPDYRATGFIIDKMPNQEEHDKFYKIMIGDLPMPDLEHQSIPENCSSSR